MLHLRSAHFPWFDNFKNRTVRLIGDYRSSYNLSLTAISIKSERSKFVFTSINRMSNRIKRYSDKTSNVTGGDFLRDDWNWARAQFACSTLSSARFRRCIIEIISGTGPGAREMQRVDILHARRGPRAIHSGNRADLIFQCVTELSRNPIYISDLRARLRSHIVPKGMLQAWHNWDLPAEDPPTASWSWDIVLLRAPRRSIEHSCARLEAQWLIQSAVIQTDINRYVNDSVGTRRGMSSAECYSRMKRIKLLLLPRD